MVFTNASDIPFDCGLRAGVGQGRTEMVRIITTGLDVTRSRPITFPKSRMRERRTGRSLSRSRKSK